MYLFDIDFKNVYKKVDHHMLICNVIKTKIDRLLRSLCIIIFLFIRIIWFNDLKEKKQEETILIIESKIYIGHIYHPKRYEGSNGFSIYHFSL